MQYSRGKSALVFCSTRKGAQEAAQRLTQTVMAFGHSNPFIKSREQQERLREASFSCGDKQMQSYIPYGGKGYLFFCLVCSKLWCTSRPTLICYQINCLFAVGYHNGGLSMKDRNLIESLFLKGDIQVLCTTNTLAHGINLPAHTVVIKSTQHLYVEVPFLPTNVLKLERTSSLYSWTCASVQQQRKRSLHGIWPVYNTTGLSRLTTKMF